MTHVISKIKSRVILSPPELISLSRSLVFAAPASKSRSLQRRANCPTKVRDDKYHGFCDSNAVFKGKREDSGYFERMRLRPAGTQISKWIPAARWRVNKMSNELPIGRSLS